MKNNKQRLFHADGGGAAFEADSDLGRKLAAYGRQLQEMPWTGVRNNGDGTNTIVTPRHYRCSVFKVFPEQWRNVVKHQNGMLETGEVLIQGVRYSEPYMVSTSGQSVVGRKHDNGVDTYARADLIALMKAACEAVGVKAADMLVQPVAGKRKDGKGYNTQVYFRALTEPQWKAGVKFAFQNAGGYKPYEPANADIPDLATQLAYVDENAKVLLTLSELAMKVAAELGTAEYTNDKAYAPGGRTVTVAAGGYTLSYHLPYKELYSGSEADAMRQQAREDAEADEREAEARRAEQERLKAEQEALKAEAEARKAVEDNERSARRAELLKKAAPAAVLALLAVAVVATAALRRKH